MRGSQIVNAVELSTEIVFTTEILTLYYGFFSSQIVTHPTRLFAINLFSMKGIV